MRTLLLMTVAALLLAGGTAAQQTAAIAGATVPRLVRVANTFHPASGPTSPVESVTLSIYKEEQGGTALWSETQNVAVDEEGRYTALMGSTLPGGVPSDLFSAGEPRWLGVQFNRSGEWEPPRIQLVSVPYALKAVDAETLGGKPASAYLLAPSIAETSAGGGTSSSTIASTGSSAVPTVKSTKPQVTSGMTNCIGMFTNSTDMGCSVIWQNGINIGIDTMNPGAALDLGAGSIRVANYSAPSSGAGLEMAYIPVNNSGYLFAYDRGASVAKDLNIGGSGAAITVKASGNVGVGVANPTSKLDVAGDINFSGGIRYQGSPLAQVPGVIGANNLALGVGALNGSTSGVDNTAIGASALSSNTTGSQNTATGDAALESNTTGTFNTATGVNALVFNTTGSDNTATGGFALESNTGGANNTATGFAALQFNTGDNNTATGYTALNSNTTGGANTATGQGALYNNTSGGSNTATGLAALSGNTTGSWNTAYGVEALWANGTGHHNIAIGFRAAFSVFGAYNIHIGSEGASSDNGTIRIGTPFTQTSFFAAGIRGVTTANNDAVPVVIDSNGQLGTVSSSRRYKEDIRDMGDTSSDLMRLRPVTFRYKKPFEDGSKPVQYGLIAEEVAEVYPDLVARGADGQVETVKYQLLPTMILNEVQRQEHTIQEQAREIDALKAKLAELSSLEARLAALETAAGAQR